MFLRYLNSYYSIKRCLVTVPYSISTYHHHNRHCALKPNRKCHFYNQENTFNNKLHGNLFYRENINEIVLLSVSAQSSDMVEEIKKEVLVPIGNGSEEMEAVIVIDVLRRANINVTVASVEDDLTVICSRGIKITADTKIELCQNNTYDAIALPGGMPGAERLRDNKILNELLLKQNEENKRICAICASPAVVLETSGLLKDKEATSHPNFSDKLKNQKMVNERVVVDGHITTSRGPGTAFEFALEIINQLCGQEKMNSVAKPMMMYDFKLPSII